MVTNLGVISQYLPSSFEPDRQTIGTLELNSIICSNCEHRQPGALKFCTNCGVPPNNPARTIPVQSAPDFAAVHIPKHAVIPKELQEQLGKLLISLAQQRIFLYFHWLVFFSVHIFGFVFGYHCYQLYSGEEGTKICVALEPMFFINLAAFLSLAPIKSTKMQIVLLKEKVAYLHHKIEYRNLY